MRIAVPALCAVLLLAATARADQVLLRSGEVLTGRTAIEGQTLRIELGSGEVRTLPLSAVDRIRHTPGTVAHALVTDGTVPPPPPPPPGVTSVERLGVAPAALAAPCPPPCAPCPPDPCADPCEDPCKWDGPWSLSIGLSWTQAGGNSDSLSFKADFELLYEKEPWKWLTKGFYVYAETSGETDTNRFFVQSQVDRRFWECWYAFVKGSYDTDSAADLDYRIVGTGGVGTPILRGPSYELNAEIGGGATAERRSGSPETVDPSAYLGLDFTKEWAKAGKITIDYDFLPNLDDFDLSLMRFDARYELPLSKCLSFRAGLRLDYQIDPPQPGVEDLDWIVSAGLGVSF